MESGSFRMTLGLPSLACGRDISSSVGRRQYLHRVNNFDTLLLQDLQLRGDLHHAADIACDHRVGARGDNRFGLPPTKFGSDRGLIEIIRSCRPATDFSVIQFDQFHVPHRFEQSPGALRTDCP